MRHELACFAQNNPRPCPNGNEHGTVSTSITDRRSLIHLGSLTVSSSGHHLTHLAQLQPAAVAWGELMSVAGALLRAPRKKETEDQHIVSMLGKTVADLRHWYPPSEHAFLAPFPKPSYSWDDEGLPDGVIVSLRRA